MKKRIVLCADDYGQAPAISQGIIALIKAKRLSATSCMVTSLDWAEQASWLAPFQAQIDIGLHFNLTEGTALSQGYIAAHGNSFYPLPRLLCQAFLRRLDKAAIAAECHAQIDQFAKTLGFLPHFIDGHQHVHQFPVIREAFMQVYAERLSKQNTYVRWVQETASVNPLKKMIIDATGTRALKRLLEQHQIPHNHSFAGIYSFSPSTYLCTAISTFFAGD